MTKFLFVRHGESKMNLTPELIGGRSNETMLTVRGLYQAALVGAYLRESEKRFDAVFSSGAVRADQTAEVIVEAAGYDIPVSVDERLQEVSQGEWEGRLRSEVYTDEIIRSNRLEELDGHLPGAESARDAQRRMFEFATDARETYPERSLLVIGHGLSIRSFAGAILGLTKQQILNDLETPNVSLTGISVDEEWSVDFVGKTIITE